MRRLFNKKAQNTAEYAIVIALVIGTALAAQTYVKRGIQGRIKDAADTYATADDHHAAIGIGGADVDYSFAASRDAQMGPTPGTYLEQRRSLSELQAGTQAQEQQVLDGSVRRDETTIERRETSEEYGY